MSSLPVKSVFRPQSLSGVKDVIQSYRRAQAYRSDSVFASTSGSDVEDVEEQLLVEEENQVVTEAAHTAVITNLQWDEDLIPGPSRDATAPQCQFLLPTPRREVSRTPATPTFPIQKAQERTPLLGKATSSSFMERSNCRPANIEVPQHVECDVPQQLQRRTSQLSSHSVNATGLRPAGKPTKVSSGQSTFGQTLFNAIAILLGIGMLSEPLAFAYAGWIGGTLIIVFYGLITCYTAKLLARTVLEDPRLKSYSDIGRKAFGPRSGPWISAVFCLELFTVSVALVTLYADSLYAVLPAYSPNTYKIVGLIILIPTTLLPLSVLSYASVVGILSTLLIISVVLVEGLSKPDSPGSLWSPADTSLGVRGVGELGISFGLFMAGFSGHAVIPSLVRDMADPTQFHVMIDYAFTTATAIYAIIGVAGYIMFGNSVSDEFSQDLVKHSVHPVLTKIALWGLVVSPLSKFALSTRPLNLTLEMILGIETSSILLDDHSAKPTSQRSEPASHNKGQQLMLKRTFIASERAIFTVCSVLVSIFVPEFSSMMAFLGAFSSFLLCVIGPVSAKVALAGKCGAWDAFLLTSGIIMATWGTITAFWSIQP
ncbi:hypothetical protein AcW2_000971 [Taiwanofungus camphoratus]|nr:hypothetical protein AcW2_000971 [Antrodia cinnamomea]